MTQEMELPRIWLNNQVVVEPIETEAYKVPLGLDGRPLYIAKDYADDNRHRITQGRVVRIPERVRLNGFGALVLDKVAPEDLQEQYANGQYQYVRRHEIEFELGDIIGFDEYSIQDDNQIEADGKKYAWVDYNMVIYYMKGERVIPQPGWVLASKIKESELTMNGLIISTQSRYNLLQSKIRYSRGDFEDIQVGDVVCHPANAALPCRVNGEDLVRIAWNQLMAVVV